MRQFRGCGWAPSVSVEREQLGPRALVLHSGGSHGARTSQRGLVVISTHRPQGQRGGEGIPAPTVSRTVARGLGADATTWRFALPHTTIEPSPDSSTTMSAAPDAPRRR